MVDPIPYIPIYWYMKHSIFPTSDDRQGQRKIDKDSGEPVELFPNYSGSFHLMDPERFWSRFRDLDDRYRKDREVVMAILDHCLGCGGARLDGLAIDRRGDVFWAIPEKFRGDREVILKVVEYDGRQLRKVSEEFRGSQFPQDKLEGDAEVIRAAVKSNGIALEICPLKYRDDAELMYGAVFPFSVGVSVSGVIMLSLS